MNAPRLVALTALILLTGCPGAGTTQQPAFTGFEAGVKLTGRFVFAEKDLSQTLDARFMEAGKTDRFKTDFCKSGEKADEKVPADPKVLGHFAFKAASMKDGSDYQVVWDDCTELVGSQGVNIAGVLVSDPFKAPPAQLASPLVTMDLEWRVKDFKPNVNGTFADKFELSPYPRPLGPAEHFVQVSYLTSGDPKTAAKTACWDSAKSATVTQVDWRRKCSTTVGATTGSAPPAGASLFWRAAFVKAGTTQDLNGKKEFFGYTRWIPFSL